MTKSDELSLPLALRLSKLTHDVVSAIREAQEANLAFICRPTALSAAIVSVALRKVATRAHVAALAFEKTAKNTEA